MSSQAAIWSAFRSSQRAFRRMLSRDCWTVRWAPATGLASKKASTSSALSSVLKSSVMETRRMIMKPPLP